MAVSHYFRRRLGGLFPTTEAGEEWLASVPPGEIVRGQFSRPRNVKFHRKFFALLNLIYQNQSHYDSVDALLLAFKYKIGHGEWVVTRDRLHRYFSVELFKPHSISFAKMSEDEFAAFYEKAMQFVLTEVIPGMDREDLEQELREFAE